ncbi:MAG: S8 family serine peptidase [Lewinellaceae bacterium]|nr:S8 family serine peptidase [Lewinellaceae bacterium]
MKIRFIEETYIRALPKTKGNQPLGTMHLGAEIDVEPDTVKGESLEGNNQWYRDNNGWHYWSGRTEVVAPPPPQQVETTGGFVMAPATPQEIAAAVEEPGVPVIVPPLANDDDQWRKGEIPDGETRVVPPLDVLLELEKQSRTAFFAGLPTRLAPAQRPPVDSGLESTRRGTVFPPPNTTPPPPIVPDQSNQSESIQSFWQNPAPRRLNWCLQNYRIAQDWWQSRGITGDKVTIALLGTGVATNHPDLQNLRGGFCFPNNKMQPEDRHGLGTQAAIVAAGMGHTVFGVAPAAQLLVGKIGEQDHLITPEGLIAGLGWAIEAGADVIAMLVDFPDMQAHDLENLKTLVQEAGQRGILLVAPVGTSDNKKPESRYPAQLDGVLSVGAHDQYGQRSSFSARSYHLDLLVPGEGLLTAMPDGRTTYNQKSTAIAAAFAAGFLALVRQWQWEKHQQVEPNTVFDLLRQTAVARRTFNKGDDIEQGHGILNPVEILNHLETR